MEALLLPGPCTPRWTRRQPANRPGQGRQPSGRWPRRLRRDPPAALAAAPGVSTAALQAPAAVQLALVSSRSRPANPKRPGGCPAGVRRLLSGWAAVPRAIGTETRGTRLRAAVPSAREATLRAFLRRKDLLLFQGRVPLRNPDFASRADGTPCHAENGRNCQFSRAGGVPKLVCFGQQERPISSTASSCTTQYRRLIPSAFADKKPDLANL